MTQVSNEKECGCAWVSNNVIGAIFAPCAAHREERKETCNHEWQHSRFYVEPICFKCGKHQEIAAKKGICDCCEIELTTETGTEVTKDCWLCLRCCYHPYSDGPCVKPDIKKEGEHGSS